jgi:hypothetical protein
MIPKPERSYWGNLEDKLLGENLGSFIVDQTFQRIIDRNNEKLAIAQSNQLNAMDRSIKEIVKHFQKDLKTILNDFTMKLEDLVDKEIKEPKAKEKKTKELPKNLNELEIKS